MTDNGNPAYPPERKALHAALAAAQGEFPKITKDKVADAGSYQYAYASLEHILEVVRPVLTKHGLSIIQPLEEIPGGVGPVIRTELRHVDGDMIARPFPLGDRPKNPQQLGSLVSYIKRYALMGMLGIAPEDDDDGKAAATAKKEAPFKPPPLKPEPVQDFLDAKQRRQLFAIKTKLTDAKVFTDEQFKAQLQEDYNVISVSDLTKNQAEHLIARLVKREKALDEGTPGA